MQIQPVSDAVSLNRIRWIIRCLEAEVNDNESPQCVASPPHPSPNDACTHQVMSRASNGIIQHVLTSLLVPRTTVRFCTACVRQKWVARNKTNSCYSVMSGELSPHFSIIPTLMCHHIKRELHVNNHHLLHHFNFTGSNVATFTTG